MSDRRQVPTTAPLRVLRISHSSVVSSWRKREQGLRDVGIEVTLVTARSWQEGGGEVKLDTSADENVLGATTFGDHPCGFLYDPTAIWKALRSVPHDVLDVHEEPYSLAAIEVVLLRWLARRRQPLVFYSAQNLPKRHPLPVRLTERVVLAVAKGAYPCNQAAAANLRRKAFHGTIRMIPLGVDPPTEAPRPHDGTLAGSTEGPRLRVGCAGRLSTEKGFHTAIEAVASEPNWELTIVGDGPERAHLASLAASLGASDRVDFQGHRSQDDVVHFYRSIDVLAVPSVPMPGLEEQFGRVAAEAMAAGVPVVSSTCGSLPDVVGDAGLLVTPGDTEGLRAALALLADQPSVRAQLAQKGLERARVFSWQSVAKEQLALYRSALGGPSTPQLAGYGAGGNRRPIVAVVVAYGGPEMLEAALAKLESTQSAAQSVSVIVVDNSSNPAVEALAELHSACYVNPGRNLGFAAAVNLALAQGSTDDADVLLLNPDAEVDGSTVLALQRRLHSESRLACVAPAQQGPDGEEHRVAWPFPSPARSWAEAVGLGKLVDRHDFLIGSVLLLNRTAINEVGLFDETFFLYAEEADWQERARAKGWGVRLCQELHALHVGGATSSDSPARRDALFMAAQELYLRKWYGPVGWHVARAAVITGALARALLLRGAKRSAALDRARRYAAGPFRQASLLLRRP